MGTLTLRHHHLSDFGQCECGCIEMDPSEYGWLDQSDPLMSEMRLARNLTVLRVNFSPRTKLILEVLMVLMCVGAVTGDKLHHLPPG